MKKQIKKIAICLASAIMLQMSAMLPANAAAATVTGTDFETNCSYTVKESGDFLVGDAFYVKNGNALIKNPVYAEDGETVTGYTTDSISIVNDPVPEKAGDKAFKVKRGAEEKGAGQSFFKYSPASGMMVWEYDIMFDEAFHNMVMLMQTSDWKEIRLMGTANSNGAMKILDKSNGTAMTTASLNEWHHVKVIADFTETKEIDNGDGTTKEVLDFSKNNITVYFDDVIIHDHDTAISLQSGLVDGTTAKTFMLTFNTVTNEPNIYIDNYRTYSITDDNETSFEMKSYDDYEDGSFMNGTTFKFYADSIMGADTGYNPVNKVVWYVDGEEKATTTKYPFSFECAPTVAGYHTVSCEAYTDNDTEALAYDEMTVFVEPKFREEFVIKESFENYTDGTTLWDDATGNGTWRVLNTTAENGPVGVTVDDEHGKSIYLGTDNNRRLDGWVNNYIYEGTIRVSGEIYLDGEIGNNNVMFGLRLNSDTASFNLHNAKKLIDRQNGNAELFRFTDKKWYKLDWITTIKDGQAYYTAYVDGRQVTQNAYPESVNASVFKGAIFLNSTNTNEGKIYVDNLSISKIEYYDNTGFWSGSTEVDTLAEMPGTVLTAKTAVVSENENQQYMAVYDKTTNELKAIEVGTYDLTTGMYTVSCDLKDMENIYVKVFVWDGLRPNLSTPEIIE